MNLKVSRLQLRFLDSFTSDPYSSYDYNSKTVNRTRKIIPIVTQWVILIQSCYDQDVSLSFLNVTQKRVNRFWRNLNWIFLSVQSNDTEKINSLEVTLKEIVRNSWEPFSQRYLPRILEYLPNYKFQRIDFHCVFRWITKQYAFQISSKSVFAFSR